MKETDINESIFRGNIVTFPLDEFDYGYNIITYRRSKFVYVDDITKVDFYEYPYENSPYDNHGVSFNKEDVSINLIDTRNKESLKVFKDGTIKLIRYQPRRDMMFTYDKDKRTDREIDRAIRRHINDFNKSPDDITGTEISNWYNNIKDKDD